VVIPALDEARSLPLLLSQLAAQRDLRLQIVVADGGSGDDTARIARNAGAVVVLSPRGRGAQMNAGARAASAAHLVFLHADSQLPQPRLLADALAAIRDVPRAAGHFPLRFAGASPAHATFYRYLEGKTRLNRVYTINGDQGLLIARAFFDEIGGFDESLPFLEDQRIAAKIFEHGHWIVLPGELVTSARRFETEGVRERYTLMALIMGLHAGGADDYFATAPRIYAAPDGRLDLAAHVDAIANWLDALEPARRRRLWRQVGSFVRDNAWQLAYRRDVLVQDRSLTRLQAFDRFIAPLLRNAAAQFTAALLTRAYFQRLRWRQRA
jgi:rSAM/selenodomain-associated transferase 2